MTKRILKKFLILLLGTSVIFSTNTVFASPTDVAGPTDAVDGGAYNFTADTTLTVGDGISLRADTDANVSVSTAAGANTGTVTITNSTTTTVIPGKLGAIAAANHLNTININTARIVNVTSYDIFAGTACNFGADGTLKLGWDVDLINIAGDIHLTTSTDETGTLILDGNNGIDGNIGTAASSLKKVVFNDGVEAMYEINALNVELKEHSIIATFAFDMVTATGSKGILAIYVENANSYGQMLALSADIHAATTTVDATVKGYIKTGSVLNVVDTAGGGGIEANIPVVDSSPVLTFTSAAVAGDDLVLTVSSDYAGVADNENNAHVGETLEAIDSSVNGATGDMETVFSSIDQLTSQADVNNAYSQMQPSVDAGVINADYDVVDVGNEAVLAHVRTVHSAESGVSTGSPYKMDPVWADGFGSYVNQDKRKGIDGYRSRMGGVKMGYDCLVTDRITLGVASGYAYSSVDSKKSNIDNTDINSALLDIYGAFKTINPVFVNNDAVYVDLIGGFGWNWYDGSRNIPFGSISRQAKGDYKGQQYSVYGELGYELPCKGFMFTPFLSLGWTHLNLGSYTENGAGDLNLNISSQKYDKLDQGLGMRAAYPIRRGKADIIPEVKVKWIYDYLGEAVEMSSTFAGGGPGFSTNGCKPAQGMVDFGAALSFIYGNTAVAVGYNFGLKEGYYSNNGNVIVKYQF